MYKFEITEKKPKELIDIYSEFEGQFSSILYNSINECRYLELVKFVGGDEDWIPTIPEVVILNKKIKNEKILEKHFNFLIESLIQHIDEQLTNYVSGRLSNFFTKTHYFYQKNHPTEKGKKLSETIFYNVSIMSGQEEVDENFKELGQYAKKTYTQKYEEFHIEVQKLEDAYSKFTVRIDPIKSVFNKSILSEFGFFELEKVKKLSVNGQHQLLELVFSNDLPYKIAMFDYLGFLLILFKRLKTKENGYRLLSSWFNIDLRTVKGNCLVLHPKSSEDRSRYTADEYVFKVKEDFLKIV